MEELYLNHGTGRQHRRCIVPKAVYTVKKCSWEWANLWPESCWADLRRSINEKVVGSCWLFASLYKNARSHKYQVAVTAAVDCGGGVCVCVCGKHKLRIGRQRIYPDVRTLFLNLRKHWEANVVQDCRPLSNRSHESCILSSQDSVSLTAFNYAVHCWAACRCFWLESTTEMWAVMHDKLKCNRFAMPYSDPSPLS